MVRESHITAAGDRTTTKQGKKNSSSTRGSVLKESLNPEERGRVIAAAHDLGGYQGYDAERVILFFLCTGAHPAVLANRQRSHLQVQASFIQWSRPKKTGAVAVTRVPIHSKLAPWISDWVLLETPNYREWYWGLVKAVGVRAGIPSLSPMALRHTFGVILDEMGMTLAEICQLMNCSPSVARRYLRRREEEMAAKLKEGGRW